MSKKKLRKERLFSFLIISFLMITVLLFWADGHDYGLEDQALLHINSSEKDNIITFKISFSSEITISKIFMTVCYSNEDYEAIEVRKLDQCEKISYQIDNNEGCIDDLFAQIAVCDCEETEVFEFDMKVLGRSSTDFKICNLMLYDDKDNGVPVLVKFH